MRQRVAFCIEVYMKKMCRVLLALMVIWLGITAAASAAQAENTTVQDVQATVLETFIRSKTQEVDTLQRDLNTLEENFNAQTETFTPYLEDVRARLQAFDVMARMVKTNPYDMRVALAEAKFLQLSVTKNYQPLQALLTDLAAKAETVKALDDDLERRWSASLERELRKDIQPVRQSVSAISKQVVRVQAQADKLGKSVTDVQTRIQEWITTFETELPLIWKAEFLDQSRFQLLPDSSADVRQELRDWILNMQTFFRAQFSSLAGDDGDWAGIIVLFWLPLVLIGVTSHRYLSDVFDNAHAGGRRTSAFAILCLSLGLTLLAAFVSGKVKQTSMLLAATHILMLFGVQALAWLFRNVRGILATRTWQPLLPLVVLSMMVSILDLLRMPGWCENLIWIGLLVLSSLLFGLIRPKLGYERFIRGVHPYVMAVLVAVAVSGWDNLAILASTLWGVLALAIQLGIGSTSVLKVVFERIGATGLRALVADLLQTFLTLLIWFGVVVGVGTWITINLGTSAVVDHLSSLELNWGDFSFNFLRLGVVILLFQVVRSLAAAWKTVMSSENVHWKSFDRGAAASLQRIGIYCLWLLYGLFSMNLLGISLTNFAVIAGGLSVGIGFGMQTMISNFISGLILLFDRSIQPGDVIELNGMWARVESVNIRNTVVQTYENAKIFVPNSDLIANQVINWTHRNDVSIRRDVLVGVAYGSDVEKVKALLLEAATEHPAVQASPAPWVIFSNFGGSSLDFALRFWLRHVDFSVSAPSEIREAIDAKFRENDIEIPFTQMDVRVRPGDGVIHFKADS